MKLINCSVSLYGYIVFLGLFLTAIQAEANEEVAGKAIFCKSKDADNKKSYTWGKDKFENEYLRDFVGIEFTSKKAKPYGYKANIFTLLLDKKEPNKARYYAKSAMGFDPENRPVPTYSVGDSYIDISFKRLRSNPFVEERYFLDRTSLKLDMEDQNSKDTTLNYKYSCEVLSPDALKDKLKNTARWASQNLKDTDNKRKL